MIQKLIDAYELEREMYRKCIDTDEEIEKGRAKWDSGLWIRYKVFEDTITLAPRVDAVEVVRCKDCSWCATVKSFGKEYLYCDAFYDHADGDLIGVSLMVEPNHYCAWGERRKDGKIG